ncbi:hypothetical protein C8R44DRAFT_418352 [Mycena epipterygia]|nr:hypothetical protein C8R44DRAFT_418352 [Mycena epipterygia]
MAENLPPLDGTLGCVVIGVALSTFLLGIVTLQAFSYFRMYPNDKPILKATVTLLWFLELGHSICIWHGLYSIVVTFYGQPSHIMNPPRSLVVSLFFSSSVISVVQTFYASRIHALSGDWIVTVISSLLTCARFVFGMVLLDFFWHSAGFSVLQGNVHWTFTVVASLGPAVDLLTVTALCYLLINIRRRGTTFAKTRRLVDTLILWTVETTLITTFVGVMQLVFFLSRTDLSWMVFYLIQPKLFSNSMLASLNNRQNMRAVGGSGENVLSLRSISTKNPPISNVAIQMHRVTETVRDDDVENNSPKDRGFGDDK